MQTQICRRIELSLLLENAQSPTLIITAFLSAAPSLLGSSQSTWEAVAIRSRTHLLASCLSPLVIHNPHLGTKWIRLHYSFNCCRTLVLAYPFNLWTARPLSLQGLLGL